MNFTKKEIQLAYEMKEAGLEWCPEFGDIVICRYNDWEWVLMVLKEQGDNQVLCYQPTPEKPVKEFAVLEKERVTWLPLWHQCREIMRKAGYCLTDVFEKTINDVTMVYVIYSRDGIEIARGGHTDLEAMYNVILLYVPDASRTADDVERVIRLKPH